MDIDKWILVVCDGVIGQIEMPVLLSSILYGPILFYFIYHIWYETPPRANHF